jgi:hypothetical protein
MRFSVNVNEKKDAQILYASFQGVPTANPVRIEVRNDLRLKSDARQSIEELTTGLQMITALLDEALPTRVNYVRSI